MAHKKICTCTCTRYAHAQKSVQFASTSGQCTILPPINHSSTSSHAQPTQTRLPYSNRPKQNRPCTITFKPNKPNPNQFQMVRCTSIRPTPGRGSKQSNAIHIRISIQLQTCHTKSGQDRLDSSLPSKQRAGELEYLPCSAHKMHKVGHVGPQKDKHIDKIGHLGRHTCTLAHDRPGIKPTDVMDTCKISTG